MVFFSKIFLSVIFLFTFSFLLAFENSDDQRGSDDFLYEQLDRNEISDFLSMSQNSFPDGEQNIDFGRGAAFAKADGVSCEVLYKAIYFDFLLLFLCSMRAINEFPLVETKKENVSLNETEWATRN